MNRELLEYIDNPKSSLACFNLAEWYYKQDQWASALTYYLKVTEINDNDDLTYYSLIKGGRGLHKQGHQTYMAKGMYLQAVSVLPNRTEAWYWLGKIYTELNNWFEALACAETGLKCEDSDTDVDLEYVGKYGLMITKGECLIDMDRREEAIEIFSSLLHSKIMNDNDTEWCIGQMRRMWGDNWVKPNYYKKGNELNFTFDGIKNINKNYSQAFQDIFVLSVLNGKRNGTYVEIGANEPKEHNNTYLLENNFGWQGVSFEIDYNLVNKFNGIRENKCLLQDATTADYKEIFNRLGYDKVIDYLQIDCEPAKNSFDALLQIPFDDYQFRVITFEHDSTNEKTNSYKDKSRKYLEFLGYELLVSDVSVGDNNPFEDWWIKPELIDKETATKMKSVNKINKISEYILKNNNN